MSLLGIDVGTTGCKAIVFSANGSIMATAYVEYDVRRPAVGFAELDSSEVWEKVKQTIARAVHDAPSGDPVQALAASSMGEAVVPVSKDRRILGPSILIVDRRGEEQVAQLKQKIDDQTCYQITGNPVGNQFGLSKLIWLRDSKPELYDQTYKFLNWSGFVAFMLGAEPHVDYSLANRMLLFDIAAEDWSSRMLETSGIDREKLPRCVSAGSTVGTVSPEIAQELGLPESTIVAAGTHDQCANALGSGSVEANTAMYGMGTFPTIVPVFADRKNPEKMVELGLNTEHHAVPGSFVSFIYHMGGSAIKWYRDTFAREEHRRAQAEGEDIYERLFSELPAEAGPLLVLPHFAPMGPPDFLSDSCGLILGLKADTKRGALLKALLEANNFAHRLTVDQLSTVGIGLEEIRAVGGGSRSDAACQICADIFDRPVIRPNVTEAGALGSAILAGFAAQLYPSPKAAAQRIVSVESSFEPDPTRVGRYREIYEKYLELRSLSLEFTRDWSSWKDAAAGQR